MWEDDLELKMKKKIKKYNQFLQSNAFSARQ